MGGWHDKPTAAAKAPSVPADAGDLDIGQVRALLLLGGVPWGELDDGVQQVRLKLLEAQTSPDRTEIHNPAAWVTTVASRIAVDWHRDRARQSGLRARLEGRWRYWPPQQTEETRVRALAVAEGLETLTPVQRQVLVLRFYADLTVSDIARRLGIPEGTVKSRLNAATGAMRKWLTTKGEDAS
ncbi:sigma-70 family RNA polymerase sigma factor [Streptomyces sp. YC504]|uniref:Sigma-70 family RNA polymerase sigma factor n=1 Tax=Streptomyces mesophilus TaxID=1775132 RepID=A0A6G4XTJ5_9ACTN|nr:sigma-70 family RNA polymerase sigma factor [Streptomyces mesophilus]NGO80522.1 sigma-70 family RNA polymerase sigma factor [Streptomyces mesophilus]